MSVTLDLADYYQTPLCPGCGGNLEQPDHPCECDFDHVQIYNRYRESAAARFGAKSLPLCRHCFFRHAEWEEDDFLPSSLDGISSFERRVLLNTTLVPPK